MVCPKCNADMVLGVLSSNRDRMAWTPPKAAKDADRSVYPPGVMLGKMRPIGGSPVDAFCCPTCYSIFVDGDNAVSNNK